MKRLAMITARGGSKRIPYKNIRDFCGKPIITYSIKAALQAGVFDEIMVSTDNEEIARAGKAAGASIPFMRSENTSGDYATTAEVILEVLKEYEERGQVFDTACCIYPTAPFVTGEKLKKAIQLLEEEEYDSVMPVAEFSFPPLRGMVMKDNKITYKWEEFSQCRSQDLEKIYHDCGQFYCIRVESFQKHGTIIMDNTAPFIQDEMNVQDIDTLEDWQLAEVKYRILHPETGK